MLPDHQRILDDVAVRINKATTVADACRAAVSGLREHTPAMAATLLHVRDHLRCVAATGSWQVYSSVRSTDGVVGRVYSSGKTEVVHTAILDPDYIPLGTAAAVEICTPIVDASKRPVGVLNVEWASRIDTGSWSATIGRVAALLGVRIRELGGPPPETLSEKLLRYAVAFTRAADERELLDIALDAARDLSGLSAAILVLPTRDGVRAFTDPSANQLEHRLCRQLHDSGFAQLARLNAQARRHGASYTIGDPAELDAHGFEDLTQAGVRTMIVVPVGPQTDGGVLLAADESVRVQESGIVNLLELLGAQAWSCMDRLRSLRKLRRMASSDPLTGLRHHGAFGERLATAIPGHTAILAIDVDQFKRVNDTFGHQAGDKVLIDLARALQSELRRADDLYRIGGDEFVAVVDVQRTEETRAIAERLAAAARATGRTISVGATVQGFGEAPELALRRADAALYEVKRAGGDGANVAETPTPTLPAADSSGR